MGVLYIPGSQPGAGKTALSISLACSLSEQGKQVALFKPLTIIPERGHPYTDADMPFYSQTLPSQPIVPGEWPLAITTQEFLADADSIILKVKEETRRLLKDQDTVIVEGLDDLDPASETARTSAKLAQALNARVIPTIRHQPDLTYQEVFKSRELFGDQLSGVVINGVLRFTEHQLRNQIAPQIESQGVPVLGIFPEDRALLAVSVKDIAEHLQGEIAYQPEKANDLVEYFMVGGWIMDSGVHVFSRRDRKAVIARHDRPDIQMAALETDPVCLVLTGGGRPIEYVEYELKEREIPVILVKQDTLTAMSDLDTISARASIHHIQKIERFREMIKHRFNFNALFSSS